MACENCKKPHDGKYGSGRFCSIKCARSFSTSKDRVAISAKVSNALSGRPLASEHPAHQNGWATCPESRAKASATITKRVEEEWPTLTWDQIKGKLRRKRRIMEEQDGKCAKCGNGTEWQGEQLNFHLDHINGQNDDNRRENLRMLCPNCHSQTETYCGRNKKLKRLCTEANA